MRDGIDGFRVKTMAPAGGLAIDLANRHALGVDTYDYYCGYTSSLVAVDVGGVESVHWLLVQRSYVRNGQRGKS